MSGRLIRIAALAVLGLYLGAVAHQLAPHTACHGAGQQCSFCLLLSACVVVAGVFALAVTHLARYDAPESAPDRLCRPFPYRLPVRGPPPFFSV